MEKYVHEYYYVKKLQAACAGEIPNITDKQQWPIVDKVSKCIHQWPRQRKDLGDRRRI
jgi:hypothetical protein